MGITERKDEKKVEKERERKLVHSQIRSVWDLHDIDSRSQPRLACSVTSVSVSWWFVGEQDIIQ